MQEAENLEAVNESLFVDSVDSDAKPDSSGSDSEEEVNDVTYTTKKIDKLIKELHHVARKLDADFEAFIDHFSLPKETFKDVFQYSYDFYKIVLEHADKNFDIHELELSLREKTDQHNYMKITFFFRTQINPELARKSLENTKLLIQEIDANISRFHSVREEIQHYSELLYKTAVIFMPSEILATMLFAAGSCKNLVEATGSALKVLGNKPFALSSIENISYPVRNERGKPDQGFGALYYHESVQCLSIEERPKAVRSLAGKLALALKCDFHTSKTDHSYFSSINDQIQHRLATLTTPFVPKKVKALHINPVQNRVRRGGRRKRKYKIKYMLEQKITPFSHNTFEPAENDFNMSASDVDVL